MRKGARRPIVDPGFALGGRALCKSAAGPRYVDDGVGRLCYTFAMGFLSPKEVLSSLHLRADSAVADFGAGSGAYTFALAERIGEEGAVYAFDIQRDLVGRIAREAQERGLSQIKPRAADLEAPQGSGLSEASVDAVILSNILFQSDRPEAILTEARRVLRPGGEVLIVDWLDSFGGLGPPPERVILPERAKAMLESLGFSVEREWVPADHHWALIARKPR